MTSTVFETVKISNAEGFHETGPAMHSSNHVFWSEQFRKYLSYHAHVFFPILQNVIYILEMQQNIQKKFLVFKISAFDLVAINSIYYGENTWNQQSMG